MYMLLHGNLIVFKALLIGMINILFKARRYIWVCQHVFKYWTKLVLVMINLTGNRLDLLNEKLLKNVAEIFHFFL